MDRLVSISSGFAVVAYKPRSPLGFVVELRSFDRDGWQREERRLWSDASMPDLSLLDFVSESLGIPRNEAERLLLEIQYDWFVEWEERTPEQYKSERRGSFFFSAAIVLLPLVLVSALWGALLTAWSLYKAIF
jgi:hypothetical protein